MSKDLQKEEKILDLKQKILLLKKRVNQSENGASEVLSFKNPGADSANLSLFFWRPAEKEIYAKKAEKFQQLSLGLEQQLLEEKELVNQVEKEKEEVTDKVCQVSVFNPSHCQ